MNRLTARALSAAALAGALFLAPTAAHAGIEACGNIDVKANANCKVEVKGGCTAQCEPVRFEAACAGKFQAKCDGRCTANVTTQCTGTCGGSCNATCNASTRACSLCAEACNANCNGNCNACHGYPPTSTHSPTTTHQY